MSKYGALVYGLVSYVLFLVVFLYAIGFVSGFLVVKTIDTGAVVALAEALPVNLALMSLFAIQHSLMARQPFKNWWGQYVPKSIERSTYVLLSSLGLALLFWQWRPIPDTVWTIANPSLAAAVLGLSLLGWLTVLSSTFLINHFELSGLYQVANKFTDRAMPSPRFYRPLLYRFVRHPIYLGFIVAFWAASVMTLGHLLFAAVTTAYIFLGIFLEERDHIAIFGDNYVLYKKPVSMILPWRRSTSLLD